MGEILRLLELAFREHTAGRVEMPPKFGIHTRPDAFSHAMPAYLPTLQAAGMKWVSAYPENNRRGLPNISGLLVLNDVENGLPYAVMDCTWITAMRTGAATALSARYLANPQSEVVGILACGQQGRSNLLALASLFPLKRALAYDIDPQAQQRYVEEMGESLGIEILPVQTPHQAVIGCDLVVTSGPIQKHATPTIEPGWLKPGAFASSVDFASCWSTGSLRQMDRIATDDLPQYHSYRQSGYFAHVPTPYADLGQLVAGKKPGRQHPGERTIAINLGLALEDLAVAPEIYRRAQALNLGTWLSL